MDPLNLVEFARALVDIDSTTGREQAAGEHLASALARLGYTVERQMVANGRFNVLARVDEPSVVFSTHFDCVPPFFPSRIEGGRLFGRGSSDAKGTLAAQMKQAKAGGGAEGLGAKPGGGAFAEFRRMEEKIEGHAAEVAASREVDDALRDGGLSREELEAKFAALERGGPSGSGDEKPGGKEIDDELAALKKKVRIGSS